MYHHILILIQLFIHNIMHIYMISFCYFFKKAKYAQTQNKSTVHLHHSFITRWYSKSCFHSFFSYNFLFHYYNISMVFSLWSFQNTMELIQSSGDLYCMALCTAFYFCFIHKENIIIIEKNFTFEII